MQVITVVATTDLTGIMLKLPLILLIIILVSFTNEHDYANSKYTKPWALLLYMCKCYMAHSQSKYANR